jgi:methyl acetate hydrolase
MAGFATLPVPTVTPAGKTKLDHLLEEIISQKQIPSIFWAATNAKETIYENEAGNVVMGDETSGKVNRDTSALRSITVFCQARANKD